MNGSTALYTVLSNDSPTVALLTSLSGNPAIVVDPREPTTWGPTYTTISIYSAVSTDQSAETLYTTWTVNCRAATAKAATALGETVISALDRVAINTDEGRFYCVNSVLLAPANETDSYNFPVEVTIKGMRSLD